ncbi:chitinase-like protein Idgf4 [Coccinella septempunctata]|uniref:chitinase-like protein Idgf4 n=1 Tax=Coccinella septempunctata TaxID=41139 RepID=UPI001D067132|nr:chitinase-like protein Idgf4 [Coccinella septempunctata]
MGVLKYFAFFLFVLANYNFATADNKVVCYYDSSSSYRTGQGKFEISFLDSALQFCSHLIYGYAGIDEKTNKLKALDEALDLNQHNYQKVTDLKRRFPGLKILLSVGGGRDGAYDEDRKVAKYLELLESPDKRIAFINSADSFLRTYGFDGLDLGWEFPETKPKKIRGKISGWFNKLKTKIVGENEVDEKATEHKEEFTALVRDLKNKFKHEGLSLTLSILPNVNSTVYFDPTIAQYLDLIILKAFDFHTPKRNPKEADYPTPLFPIFDRRFDENADYQVRYWTEHGTPRNKVILAIPSFARTWKMTEDSGLTGVPPLTVEGEGAEGPYTRTPGLLSHPEVCTKLTNIEIKHKLVKTGDPTGRHGVYAYRTVDNNNPQGIWIAYEDVDSTGSKASYAREKGLGGIAIDDLTLDDFRGLCSGNKYPVLRAARLKL